MDKGVFAGLQRLPPHALKEKQSPITKCRGEEGARAAQSSVLILTLKAPFDFTRLKVCTALPKMISNRAVKILGQSEKQAMLCAWLCLLQLLTERKEHLCEQYAVCMQRFSGRELGV